MLQTALIYVLVSAATTAVAEIAQVVLASLATLANFPILLQTATPAIAKKITFHAEPGLTDVTANQLAPIFALTNAAPPKEIALAMHS